MADQAGWIRWVPRLLILRQYRAAWLVHDMVLATILVTVGAAYAVAAGLPGECALYATTASLPTHALFGSSLILVVITLDSHAVRVDSEQQSPPKSGN
jgi:MFS superfamily sulfate permease-like transporter